MKKKTYAEIYITDDAKLTRVWLMNTKKFREKSPSKFEMVNSEGNLVRILTQPKHLANYALAGVKVHNRVWHNADLSKRVTLLIKTLEQIEQEEAA